MIRIQGLCKTFTAGGSSVSALGDVNLHVPPGAIFGVVGLSGAGKSTLIRCLAMLEQPTRGRVWLNGVEVTQKRAEELRRLRQQIGMIFQHFNLLSGRTAAENIALPLEIRGWPKPKIQRRVDELLRLVGLADKASAYPAALSGGQKQRVGIARAIAAQPAVLLCDEATSALDPETTDTILRLLRTIQQQTGITIVMVTHQLEVVQEVCSHVAVLDQGQVAEVGPVESVLLTPRAAATRRLLSRLWPTELPAHLQTRFGRGACSDLSLYRLNFVGSSALQPVISQLAQETGVSINILQGAISQVGSRPCGLLLVELAGSAESRQAALSYLANQRVRVEEVQLREYA